MAFMQKAASLHAIPSQITIGVDVDDADDDGGGGNRSMEAFFLFNANYMHDSAL